jgi:hypothetical protein
MSETLFSDLRPLVCEQIRQILPQLKTCRPQDGKFDLKELKKSAVPAPAVLVSVLGLKPGKQFSATPTHLLNMAAYVVTRDALGVDREVAALNIMQALVPLLQRQTWAVPALGEAENVRLHNLATPVSRDNGSALWAVTWDQPVCLYQPASGPLGVELYTAQAPNGVNAPEGDFEQVGAAT